jgi:hypothetical protein
VAAGPTFAATQRAEIGRFTASGTIALQWAKFQKQLADGTKIAEISVTDYQGTPVVKRKWYGASGDCRVEMAPMANSAGQILPSGFVAPAGTPVYLFSVHPVSLLACEDEEGWCHALKNVHPLGAPPAISAKCDVTEASENRCWCHVNVGLGPEPINDGLDYCTSFLDTVWDDLIAWIKSDYLQPSMP